MRLKIIIALLLLLLGLSACAAGNPAQVVEAYFQAIVADEIEHLSELTCAAREAEALAAAASFRGTGATLEGMQCQVTEGDETYQIIQCQGTIAVSYQGELRTFPLGRYRLVREENIWRVCGEA
jgi:hypothetical protein